jgi:phage baseplate assembly protein W
MKGIYRGYSSYNYQNTKNFRVYDIELVNRDLLNHIYTRKGERVMMPQWGTRIPDLVFEPLDEIVINMIKEDLAAVINFDPRVSLVDMQVLPEYDRNSITANLVINYIELNLTDRLDINIQFEVV